MELTTKILLIVACVIAVIAAAIIFTHCIICILVRIEKYRNMRAGNKEYRRRMQEQGRRDY